MKIVLKVIAFLLVVARPAISQVAVAPYVQARIEQISHRFSADPGSGYDTLLTSSFLSQVPEEQMTSLFARYFKSYGEVTGWYITDSSKSSAAAAKLIFSKGYTVDLHIAVADTGRHLISGLAVGLGSPQVKTLDALVEKIQKLPGTKGFLIANLQGDHLNEIAKVNVDTPLALGSAFKLYVLETLASEIAGISKRPGVSRKWEDVIRLDSGSRSLPSGRMHTWPVGSPVTLATVATMMISISDNTATDLLIHTLGRETIESAAARSPISTPYNVPFLTTLELFKLKSHGARLGREYLSKDLPGKRKFLESVVAKYPRDSIDFGMGEPTMIDSLEWFASPRQIAQLYLEMKDEVAAHPNLQRVMDILAVNPGLHFDKKKWKYVGYKGGSEPGVIDMSFLLQSNDGQWYVMTGAWNDPEKAVDEEMFGGLMQRAAELIP